MSKALELKQVSKVIKGRKVIDDLSFTVEFGEVFGFLGPNGAGKTTTIRMIAGLMGISKGEILICGNNVKKNFEEALLNVGGIVENPELYNYLTGYQNMMQYGRMAGGVSKQKVDEMISFVRLTDRVHDKVKTYSLGMRQRLGLAQSLLHDPKVMILDEPTNGLDPAGIREIRDHLKKLTREKGMAVIVSSHLLSEMEMMCDRFAIIQEGKLVDIQYVNENAQNEKQEYSFMLEGELSKLPSDLSYEKTPGGIEMQLKREDVPKVVKLLVENDMHVFEVKPVSKTLEDRFLEITQKGGAYDAQTRAE